MDTKPNTDRGCREPLEQGQDDRIEAAPSDKNV